MLIDKYSYTLVELNEAKFLSITPLYDLPTIPTLANHMKTIQKAKGLPVVYHPKNLTPSKMKGLLKHQIPFIVDMKQVYLPFLGTYLQAVAEREVNDSDVLWLYEPLLFSQSNIPDPISIILSLKNVHDERVEQAVEMLMDEVWEGQHGTWIKQF